jgi:hypothetical protein
MEVALARLADESAPLKSLLQPAAA